MAVFRWEGISPRGEVMRGEMEATTRDAVIVRLRTQRIQPLPAKIREKGKGLDRQITIPGLGEKVKTRDIVVFTRQFATMIDAGLPIVQCLDILQAQATVKPLRKAIQQIKDDVEAGSSFNESLRKHPKLFDELYINMVAAGEVGGILDNIMNRLAVYMEKAARLRAKIKGAMIYPASILTVAVAVTAILLVYVIPVFAELFSSFGQALPAPTQFVINLSNFTVRFFPYIITALVVAVFLVVWLYRTEQGRLSIDGFLLRLPVFGDLFRKSSVARFTRTLGTLVSSGVPILDALAITARTAGNRVVEKAVLATRISISEGKTIAEPLTQSKVFPPMVCQMIAVGETTGALDSMLGKIAEFYEEEVDNTIANLTALMEPIVIVFLGVVIGGLVISMYLPIFQLGSVISQ
ncbi:MAG: type II secretion system F family protein [Deltaproteobacteria bacterium]|nr:type II secretion system F family protein [Deltaproteobacteria bacterium]